MFDKKYLSVAVSRAWLAEFPVGDPFGGAAYGKREMPVVAVAAGMYAGAGLAAAAATTAGIVGTLGVAGTIASVGAVVAAVGTVVGNKKMTQIGGVMALAGGLWSAAESMGAFGSEVGTLDKAFGIAPGADGTYGSLAKGNANLMDQIGGGAPDVVQPNTSIQSGPITQDAMLAEQNQGLISQNTAVDGQSVPANPIQGAPAETTAVPLKSAEELGGLAAKESGAIAAPELQNVSLDKVDYSLNSSGTTSLGNAAFDPKTFGSGATKTSGSFDSIMGWMGDHPMPTMMGLQGVSGAVQAFGPAAKAAEKQAETESQLAQNRMSGVPKLYPSGLISQRKV